jgi:predicted dehydrogenase
VPTRATGSGAVRSAARARRTLRRVRVVVVGTGFGARVVAPVWSALDDVEVVDVVSARDGDAVASACARGDVDLVSVHSPPFLHAEHVHRALDAGHAVLCDKPFGRDADEAGSMVDHAQAAGVPAFVNFEFRFDPGRRAVRELLRSELIGPVASLERLTWAHWSAGTRMPLRRFGWLFSAEHGGGWIGAWASHALDTVRWLVGRGVDAAHVWGARTLAIGERPDTDGAMQVCTAEDGLVATLVAPRGPVVGIDSTFAAPVNVPGRLAIVGSQGSIESVADRRITVRDADGRRLDDPSTAAAASVGTRDRHHAGMAGLAAALHVACTDGPVDPDLAPFDDGLATVRVLDRLRRLPLATLEGRR